MFTIGSAFPALMQEVRNGLALGPVAQALGFLTDGDRAMDINFADAKKAIRRGQRSADHVIDIAHDVSQRKLAQARRAAEEAIDAGDYAVRQTSGAAQSAHNWLEAKPHLAALAALAAGVILGAILSPRR